MIQLPPCKTHAGDAGITLIEMLVALVIFAFVGLASFTMLDTLLKVRAQTEGRLDVVARIDRALAVFGHDFAQASNPAGLMLADGALSVLANHDQRHSYLIDNNAFERIIATEIGGAETLVQMLVPNVQRVQFNVLDASNVWQETWPIEGVARTPRAVRLTLSFDAEREVTRVVALTDSVLP